MIRAHAAAIKALLEAGAGSQIEVWDAEVPDGTDPPYRVIYTDAGLADVSNLAGQSTNRDWGFQTTAVGADADQARLVAEKNQAALLDATPTVTGRSCGPIRHVVTRDVQRDDDVTPPLFYAVDRWRFTSVPA